MRETLADICDEEIQSDNPSCYTLADAIIAALPDMVKPLEWRNHPDGSHALAIGLNGILYISTSGGWRTMYGDFHKTPSGKAAAQAHHVAQVLSAF